MRWRLPARVSPMLAVWTAASVAAVALMFAGAWVLLTAGMSASEREAVDALIDRRGPVLAFAAFLLVFALGGVVSWLFRRTVTAVRALADETRIVVAANPDHRVSGAGSRELALLAAEINALGDAFRARRNDLEAGIRESGSRLEAERNRLAALMSELSQAVLLCNAEGRILLYNAEARRLFGSEAAVGAAQSGPAAGLTAGPAAGPASGPTGGLVGLGRSLFGLVDRNQVAHALDRIQFALDATEDLPVTRFLTTTSTGKLVRIQLAPFLAPDRAIDGMVLLLDDVTELHNRESDRRSLLETLATSVRQPAANIRAAAENLVAFPDMDDARRAQFAHIIADEARALSESINAALTVHADALKSGLSLEETSVSDLVHVATRHIGDAVQAIDPAHGDAVDESLWVKVDSYAVVRVLATLALRLRDEGGVDAVSFRAARSGTFVHLDVVWKGGSVPADALASWEAEPMAPGSGQSPASIRNVLERHGGEIWRGSDAVSGRSWFRLLLPAADPAPRRRRSAEVETASRPEYYDFDLFGGQPVTGHLAERRLADLHYTVFDMETTGLEPSAGDEIVSIGAVRIVNGRLLRHEVFDQLVNPQRPISGAAQRITGIRTRDVQQQPLIADVLPSFHRFCEDTVLVAHNAAFDMRFLELKQAATGIHFAQPVLDTLLLSAVAHPSFTDHRLEAIAERMGLAIIGRHTALGDALVTGEIFLKLLPLLADRGIATLGQALDASRQTYYARLQY